MNLGGTQVSPGSDSSGACYCHPVDHPDASLWCIPLITPSVVHPQAQIRIFHDRQLLVESTQGFKIRLPAEHGLVSKQQPHPTGKRQGSCNHGGVVGLHKVVERQQPIRGLFMHQFRQESTQHGLWMSQRPSHMFHSILWRKGVGMNEPKHFTGRFFRTSIHLGCSPSLAAQHDACSLFLCACDGVVHTSSVHHHHFVQRRLRLLQMSQGVRDAFGFVQGWNHHGHRRIRSYCSLFGWCARRWCGHGPL